MHREPEDNVLRGRSTSMTTDMMTMGRTLYEALQHGDTQVLRSLLADDFVGDLTPGLPTGTAHSRTRAVK